MHPNAYHPLPLPKTTPHSIAPSSHPPTYFEKYSPTSPKSHTLQRQQQRIFAPVNTKNGNIYEPRTYKTEQISTMNTQIQNKNSKMQKSAHFPSQSQMQSQMEMSYPRYNDMKASYMGPDGRQVQHHKQVFSSEHVKTVKKVPRVSEPNFYQEDLETSDNNNGHKWEDDSGYNMHKMKSSDDISLMSTKNSVSAVNYGQTAKKQKQKQKQKQKIDSESRYLMRKSSFDPSAQIWMKQLNKKKTERKIMLSDFQKIHELGVGKYGKVFLAKQKSIQFICAIKIIQKQMLKQQQITEQFIRQLKIQLFLCHPNIIKMHGYFDDPINIYIIMEVAMGGQLFKQLKRGTPMPQTKIAPIMRQIVSAVNQLHSNQIIHRDIKPQNIVMHENVVKLCDFGWSVYHGQTMRSTFCGTPLYVSPEILKGNNYDEKIDIWSIGIMMYEMLVGENPFKITQEEELIKIIKDTVVFPQYSNFSVQAKDFVMACLQKNPNERANIRELVNHQFFKKYPEKEKGVDKKIVG